MNTLRRSLADLSARTSEDRPRWLPPVGDEIGADSEGDQGASGLLKKYRLAPRRP